MTIDDYRLEIEVSDVPQNPVDNLVTGLGRAMDGLESETWLNLEPASYYLIFTPGSGQDICFNIEFADQDTQQRKRRTTVLELRGNREEIILPFWRAVKEFESHSHSERAWPKTDGAALAMLEKTIKS
ncbi:hypothetical protein [Sulfitobacter mediterraneus]|uniref:hypothetical protein n=1 Tax=Sulfitobacter mediterraneus TaxID=83219 RepID=UPI0021A786EE|nr:hypothetical protein [Sulfitobacter mediterraneus]UWR11997.1 hypothetical protein K3753_03695 [Sulfitobacter mediterraneus]